MNRLLASTLTTLVLIGTLTMTSPANATNHREVMTSDSRTAAHLRRGTSASVGPERVKPVGRGWRPSAEPFDSASAASAALVPPNVEGTGVAQRMSTRPGERESVRVRQSVPSASTGRWRGPHCSTWQYGEKLTPARYLADPARALRQLHRLATCVFAWKAPGFAVPTDIIERESGWWQWAKNPDTDTACRPWDHVPYGSCGLAQHLARYWIGRVQAFLRPSQFAAWPQISPLDPRANLIVTAAMWRAQGGACPAWC